MNSFVTSNQFTKVLERAIDLSEVELALINAAECRAEVANIFALHGVPEEAEVVRFFLHREKYAICVTESDFGTQLAESIHPAAFDF